MNNPILKDYQLLEEYQLAADETMNTNAYCHWRWKVNIQAFKLKLISKDSLEKERLTYKMARTLTKEKQNAIWLF